MSSVHDGEKAPTRKQCLLVEFAVEISRLYATLCKLRNRLKGHLGKFVGSGGSLATIGGLSAVCQIYLVLFLCTW